MAQNAKRRLSRTACHQNACQERQGDAGQNIASRADPTLQLHCDFPSVRDGRIMPCISRRWPQQMQTRPPQPRHQEQLCYSKASSSR